ncbi:hypothetical protein F5876DRAFT_70155 [Lentinula aff. lateritia]|uniref:Uncharacterized protein n=1 Tax=Lentinula aff. lateritia TaxID=2804960 RepID=A0ACC1TJU5_9AGAR|nr:hypothetical protein F5876DRAFT_70155 [Lentinula aff. lateritia]
MDGLHNIIALGKVFYLDISDTPAWIVTQTNQHDSSSISLGAGKLCTDAEEQRRKETGENGHMFGGGWGKSKDEVKISQAFEQVAKEIGAKSISSEHVISFSVLLTILEIDFEYKATKTRVYFGNPEIFALRNDEYKPKELDVSYSLSHAMSNTGRLPRSIGQMAERIPSSIVGLGRDVNLVNITRGIGLGLGVKNIDLFIWESNGHCVRVVNKTP